MRIFKAESDFLGLFTSARDYDINVIARCTFGLPERYSGFSRHAYDTQPLPTEYSTTIRLKRKILREKVTAL